MFSRNYQVLCICLLLCLSPSVFAVTVHVPGYRAYEFGHADGPGDSLDVDGFGRVYVPVTFKPGRVGPAHVQRFTSDGVPEGWSRAVGQSIAVSFDGSVAYLATRGLGENILKINADGTFKELVPKAWEWIWVELDPSGHLYAMGHAKMGFGIYLIDTLNGDYQAVFIQKGDAKEDIHRDMVFYDGELYVIGVTVI